MIKTAAIKFIPYVYPTFGYVFAIAFNTFNKLSLPTHSVLAESF